MSKKGLISSLVVGLVVTIALGIYTLVSVFAGSNPAGPIHNVYDVAYRTGETVDVLKDYDVDSLSFEYPADSTARPVVANEEGVFVANEEGSVTVVANLNKKGDTNTYNISVYLQDETSGESAEHPWYVTQKKHLVELRDNFNASANAEAPAFVKVVGNIDLGDENWVPIGWEGHEFDGQIDGSGKTISNLKINVNRDNYTQFLSTCLDYGDEETTRAFLELGLFGAMKNTTVIDLNFDGVDINVAESVYEILNGEAPEGATYQDLGRVSVGVLTGYAYNVAVEGGHEVVNADQSTQLVKSTAVSRINAFSLTNKTPETAYNNGVGGLIGSGSFIRIKDYSIKTTIINNLTSTKGSYIGGVVGYMSSSFEILGADDVSKAVTVDVKNSINNVDVDFNGLLLYRNGAKVGGFAGMAFNVNVADSNVVKFVATDSTPNSQVKYGDAGVEDETHLMTGDRTFVGGAFGSLRTNNGSSVAAELVSAFSSKVERVNVKNIDVHMLGANVAGFANDVGYDKDDLVTISDSTTQGIIHAYWVAGFVREVAAGATINYTKDFETPVVDMNITAYVTGGFSLFNFGKINGYVSQSEPIENEEVVETKTTVRLVVTGLGARPSDATVDALSNLVKTSIVAGMAYMTNTHNVTVPEITNFDVDITAKNSVNFAGVAHDIKDAKISNVDVVANFTSYSVSNNNTTISTTYMVSGVANLVGAGSVIEHCDVTLNLNKGVDTKVKYAASYVGGLVARYTGDVEDKGLTLDDNTVTGEVYVNYLYNSVLFGAQSTDVFVAGGLVGAMSSNTGAGVDTRIDAVAAVSVDNTTITDNKVTNFKIFADFAEEADHLKNTSTYLPNEAYRIRAMGATIGLVYTAANDEDTSLDISTTKLSGVEIKAYELTFSYQYTKSEAEATYLHGITMGGDYTHTFGMTFRLNTTQRNDLTGIVDCADWAKGATEQVNYIALKI